MAISVPRNGKSSAYAAYLTTDDNPKEKERSDDHNDNSPNPYSCRLGFSFSAGRRPDPENIFCRFHKKGDFCKTILCSLKRPAICRMINSDKVAEGLSKIHCFRHSSPFISGRQRKKL